MLVVMVARSLCLFLLWPLLLHQCAGAPPAAADAARAHAAAGAETGRAPAVDNVMPTPKAFFLLTFDMLSKPNWPADYLSYSLFIANPTFFNAELVARVHRDVPGSKILSYFDSVSVPLKLGCSTGALFPRMPGPLDRILAIGAVRSSTLPVGTTDKMARVHVLLWRLILQGSPMGNNPVQVPLPDDPTGYYKELRQGFNTSWLLRNLDNKSEPVCIFPGLAGYVLDKASSDFLVHFHQAVTMARGFDGLYVDMLTDTYWMADDPMINPMSGRNVTSFDCDGDGQPNTLKDLQTQWKGWRPYFIAKLRAALGADKLLIGNTAGPMSLPGLNGLRHCPQLNRHQ
jgi:hypothetical protein